MAGKKGSTHKAIKMTGDKPAKGKLRMAAQMATAKGHKVTGKGAHR